MARGWEGRDFDPLAQSKAGQVHPVEHTDESLLGLDKSSAKLNIRALIDRASAGEPCPEAVPSDEILKKLAAAARLGLGSPPDAVPACRAGGQA